MLRTVFMGTPPFAATILARMDEANYRPVLVVTQPAKPQGRGRHVEPSAVAKMCLERGIECLEAANVNAPEILERLKAVAPEIIAVAAFGQILKEPLLALPSLFCLNVHGSLLPKYRGAAPVQRAIWNGDTETGVTIQKMARRLDTGDVLLQRLETIDEEDTSATLLARLAEKGAQALLEGLYRIEGGRYHFLPQDGNLATYAAKLDKSDAPLDFNLPAIEVRNRIRALYPWPVAESRFGSDRLKIFSVMLEPSPYPQLPGSLVVDHERILVVCGDARALRLVELQLENRKRVGGREFLHGFRGQLPFSRLGVL